MNAKDKQPARYGKQIYSYTAQLREIVDYGVSLEDVLSGKAAPPPMGLRVDIRFGGPVQGELCGELDGVDYLNVRADGRMELDIKGTITTPDGARIAFSAGGVGLPQPGSTRSLLRENVKLTTADERYLWVNALEIWAIGEADVGTGTVSLRGYVPE